MIKRPLFLVLITCFMITLSGVFIHTKVNASSDFQNIQESYEKEQYQKSSLRVDLSQIDQRSIVVKGSKTSVQHVIHTYNLKPLDVSEALSKRNFHVLQVPESQNYQEVLQKLKSEANLQRVEPNYIRTSTAAPQDPYYEEQWQFDPLNMSGVWGMRGSHDTVIAVLDTGVNADHPDLKGKILPGYNFLDDTTDSSDDHGHGTHIAGLITANANNEGIVGVNPSAKILPLKVAGNEGNVSFSASLDAIYHAIDQGVDVINMSYSSYQKMDSEREALYEAYKKGIVLVAAASNDDSSKPAYPASYRPVISVAATDEMDRPTSFSNYGNWIDLTAPGQNLVSTHYKGGYAYNDGTSFSSPLVAGVASLVKSHHPSWDPSEIEWAMQNTAKTFTGVTWNLYEGFGIPDASLSINSQPYDSSADAADTYGDAYQMTSTDVSNRIGKPGDTDWYTFEVEGDGETKISLDQLDDHMDLVGVLVDEEGNHTILDDYGKGEKESYTFTAEPGQYHLQVFEYYNHWSSKSYKLNVTTPNREYEPAAQTFPDVKGTWAESYINDLVEEELMVGYPNGNFGFKDSITRASASVMIAKEMDLPLKESRFSDVSPDHWAAKYIGAMEEEGIFLGYDDGTFKPNRALSREEMASLVVRAYELTGDKENEFTDIQEGTWSYEPISILESNDLVSGFPDGTFRPKKEINRAEFATLMARLLQNNR
ncbi:S8 family serine peptidase [Halobacillus aidingensis]|uniref:Serine protease, subtilisin family n=2 Tax=Halobacillus TaxID=45667 RepID=A0A1H0KMS3_HALAD|nr:S8 family serine peptidase [Halobacillus aidingensis]SDO57050.1 Serine protease, subtilisin family [Halobacillus aidingensis]